MPIPPSDITEPCSLYYVEPGREPEPVDIARVGGELVVRFPDMQPGDEDSVALSEVAGWFEQRTTAA